MEHRCSSDQRHSTPGALAPDRVIVSRSINTYWPHPSHSPAHRGFVAGRLIRDAFAVRVRLGCPRVVPSFRATFFVDVLCSTTSGSPPAALAQFLRRRHWPSQNGEMFGTPNTPTRPCSVGKLFRGFLLRSFATTRRLARPPDGPDTTMGLQPWAKPSGTFTPELSPRRSPFSVSGITIMATGHLHERDFHPLERSLASLHPPSNFWSF